MEMPMSKDGTPSFKYAREIFMEDECGGTRGVLKAPGLD